MPGKKGREVESTVHKKRREDQQPSRLEKSGGKEQLWMFEEGLSPSRTERQENFSSRREFWPPNGETNTLALDI